MRLKTRMHPFASFVVSTGRARSKLCRSAAATVGRMLRIRRTMRSIVPATAAIAAVTASLIPALAFAQPATGALSGRVFNSATKAYVRNAEVRVEGTNRVAYTEDGGHYRLVGVP